MVVILSPSAQISPYVNYEWAFALGAGVPVVPVLLEPSPGDLHPRLKDLQYRDFSNIVAPPWERLFEDLRAAADAQREFTLHVPHDAPPVVRDAAGALDSMDRDQRRSAIASLAQMNHPTAVELLAEAVRHPIREVRFGAAFQLGGTHHDPRALPVLIEALRCRDEEVKLWMVSRIGEPAVPALLEALQEDGFRRQEALFKILGYIGGPTAVQALVKYLRDPDPQIRREAAFSLSESKNSAAMPALGEAMHDPDAEVRRGVASALGMCGGARAIPALLDLLRDSERDVRHAAVCASAEICAVRPVLAAMEPLIPRLIVALLDALDDEYDQVRYMTTNALKNLCDPRAIPGLIAAVGREGTYTSGISSALQELGVAALPALREALNDPNELIRMAAVELVSGFGDAADAPRVAAVLRDNSPDVRLHAVRKISYKHSLSPVILQAVIERLHDPEEDVCIAAINELAHVRNPAAAPHLIECLANEALAPSAANALGWFDTREVRAALKAWRQRKRE